MHPSQIMLSVVLVMVACACSINAVIIDQQQRAADVQAVIRARAQYNATFISWKQQFNRTYLEDSAEHLTRLAYYKAVVDACYAQNLLPNGTFWMKPGPFADRNETEMLAANGGPNGLLTRNSTSPASPPVTRRRRNLLVGELAASNTPPLAAVDWNASGFVTPVKNQGQCGGCYSFAAAATTETINAIAANNPTAFTDPNNLSEQQILDCSFAQGNLGCNGGYISAAYTYTISNGGLTSYSNYPYTSGVTQNSGACQSTLAAQVDNGLTSWRNVNDNSVDAMQSAVTQAAVGVGIAASAVSFQNYAGGVYDDFQGCGFTVDHAVTVTGYDTTAATPYWMVKNSWGASWGMGGYILMSMAIPTSTQVPNTPQRTLNTGICSILSQPVMPILTSPPAPPPAPVSPPGAASPPRPPVTSINSAPPPSPKHASSLRLAASTAAFVSGVATLAMLLL